MDIVNVAVTVILVGVVLLMAFARMREQNRLKYVTEAFRRSHQDFGKTLNNLEKAVGMKSPPHPGLSIRHDCIEPLGISIAEAAEYLGVNSEELSDVVNGRTGISPEMAIRLDKAFGGGASTWYRLQTAYDMAQAMESADQIEVKRVAPVG